MENQKKEYSLALLYKVIAILVFIWTIIIAGSISWNIYNEHKQIIEIATKEAITHFNKDKSIRIWAASHGGVYVPSDDRTPPNPYLEHIQYRDVITSNGKSLTLMNPAYILRQLMNDYSKTYGVRGKITSLKLLNPINIPDDWERSALLSFNKGKKEVLEIASIEGSPYLRLMRPLICQSNCLKCHSSQGYRAGEIRGGVGVSLPMSEYLFLESKNNRAVYITHMIIWLIGMVGLFLTFIKGKELIGERIVAAILLQESHDKLEERVREQTSELIKINKSLNEDIIIREKVEDALRLSENKAEMANIAKSSFLANMSHEIRTPMNAIMGLTYLVLNSELTDKQKDYLNKIYNSSKSLLRIVNDILDFSKIEAGKLELLNNEFDLDNIINDLSEIIPPLIGDKKVELFFDLSSDIPYLLLGDSLRLKQILLNLINNAIKFTEEGYIIISIELVGIQKDQAELKFSIKDTGIGLSCEQKEYVFESFTQAGMSNNRKYNGTGLGLTISQMFVQMMGGEIQVESELNSGTVFYFSLKFNIKEKNKRKYILPSELENMRVLVIEDDIVSQKMLKTILESFRFNVSVAGSAEDGIEILEQAPETAPFSIIFMDWNLPGMSCNEASSFIKSNIRLTHIPSIIMIISYLQNEIMDQSNMTMIDGFLIKPVNHSMIFNVIIDVFDKEGGRYRSAKKYIPESRANTWDFTGSRILLVEDNEINQQIVCELLEPEGFIVNTVNNGKEAVTMTETASFDCILMDIQMPEMDGIEATKIIRKNPLYKDLPIIALTANVMQSDLEKYLKNGMDDYIFKPIDVEKLFAKLRKWVYAGL